MKVISKTPTQLVSILCQFNLHSCNKHRQKHLYIHVISSVLISFPRKRTLQSPKKIQHQALSELPFNSKHNENRTSLILYRTVQYVSVANRQDFQNLKVCEKLQFSKLEWSWQMKACISQNPRVYRKEAICSF